MSLDRIPRDTLAQLDAYVDSRVPPGGFVYAVLSNDLYRAALKADDRNRAALADIAQHVESQLPMACRGSREAVEAWLKGDRG